MCHLNIMSNTGFHTTSQKSLRLWQMCCASRFRLISNILKKYPIQNTLCDDFEMILFSANKCTKKNSSSNHNQCCDTWMRGKAKPFRQLATFVYSICKQKSPNIAPQSHASRFYVFIFARFVAMNFFLDKRRHLTRLFFLSIFSSRIDSFWSLFYNSLEYCRLDLWHKYSLISCNFKDGLTVSLFQRFCDRVMFWPTVQSNMLRPFSFNFHLYTVINQNYWHTEETGFDHLFHDFIHQHCLWSYFWNFPINTFLRQNTTYLNE